MNPEDLEKHVKKRLGTSLKGASKEVRDAFGAKGMFAVRQKQKANLFSLSLRNIIIQDIRSGQINSIEELDQIIDKAIATKELYEVTTGAFRTVPLFDVTLPVLENVGHSGATKAAATLTFGIVGWALASGTKSQNKKVKNVHLTLHEKGFQIHNAAPDGSNLRIEWENLLRATKNGKKIMLYLNDGCQITLKAHLNVSNEKVEEYATNLNEKACGQIESGWD